MSPGISGKAVAWLLAATALAIEIGVLALWVWPQPPMALRDWLRASQFWSLEAAFVGVLVTSALAIPSLVRSLGIRRRWWALAAALSLAAVVMALTVPARTNRILYDEQIYQNVGQNLSDLHLAQMCNSGEVQFGQLRCFGGEYNKEPNGYPYLLSVAYRLFGTHERIAQDLNALAHGAVVLVLFVISVRLFGDPRAGLLAGLAATLLPEQLRWSATAAAEPTAALWCLLAALAVFEFCRARTTRSLAWAVCVCALAVQFRAESGLILLAAGLIILIEAPEEFLRPRLAWAAVAGVALLFVHLGHLIAVRQESWGTVGPTFATFYFPVNVRVNLWFYLWDHRFPVWLLPAAVAGLFWGAGRASTRWLFAAYALLFWGIYLFFYAGSYNYGADVRYSLMTYPPLALLAGLGLSALVAGLSAVRSSPGRVTTALVLSLAWVFLWQVPYTRAVGEEGWGARVDVEFARLVSRELPPDALVLTQDPNMFLVWGVDARQMFLAKDPAEMRDLDARHGGHVYVHWGYWCNVTDPVQQKFCADALAAFPSRLIREHRYRDYRYAFYLVEPGKSR